VTLVPNINPGQQAQSTARELATQGYNLVVFTGGFSDNSVAAVARAFPHTWFANEAGTEVGSNQIPFSVAIEQGRYLDGIVAGSMTKNAKMGEVGGFPIPIEVRALDALQQGARSVNAHAQTKVLWVNSFYDPSGERQAAQALAGSGVDTLIMDSNTPAVPSVARERNLNLVGYGISAEREAPQQWLTAFTFNWGPYLVAWANGIRHKTLKARLYYWGLKQGVISQTPLGSRVPKKVAARVAKARGEIVSGKLNVFAGSSVAGESNTPTELNACCTRFVAGVTGSLPSH
jgi:basic membrane lipoprotein Med (substrate-binding protein (PBP1-ABC) superfamily)